MSEIVDLFDLSQIHGADKLAAAVKIHGIHALKFGQPRHFKPDSAEAGEILDALARQHAWESSPEDGTPSPIDAALWALQASGEPSPYAAGWLAGSLPDFAAEYDENPRRQADLTKEMKTVLKILAGVCIQRHGVDVRSPDAVTELVKILEHNEFGEHSRNVIVKVVA